MSDSWRNLTEDAIEEWFLNRLPEGNARFNDLLDVINHFAAKNQAERAEACAGLLEDALKKNRAENELVLLLAHRAAWQADAQACASYCFKTLTEFYQGKNNLMMLFLEASALANGIHPKEAFHRLQVLRNLHPGKCCYEKTWGLGRVVEIDEFDRKLVIDFEGKRAHRLAFGYAAESVRPLEDTHILALKLNNSDEFNRRVKENPAEIVKAVLTLFGEMNTARLRALMTGLIVNEKEWSSFWSSARGKLIADPLVHMPSGRNDPIRILTEKKKFDGRWRDDFLALRDAARIFAELESLYGECSPQSLESDLKSAVEDRLKFAVRGIGAEQQGKVIQALLYADAAGIGPGDLLDISVYRNAEFLSAALNSISSRLARPFLALLEKHSFAVTNEIMQILPGLSSSALNETILYCRQSGKEAQLYGQMRALLQEGALGAEMISWIGSNLDLAVEKNICRPEDFAQTALSLLQKALNSGKRKDAGQLLRRIFTDKDLLQQMFSPMDAVQRLDFCRRLNSLPDLTAGDKIEIAAKVIPVFPDLAGAFGAPVVSVIQPKLTSFRSYRERQIQLEKIINEEIPRNSKEIGVARSYGDLRENYEYKAAREMQGLLMRRKADLEQMLSEVRGSDFSGSSRETAGQGTSVELKFPDGKKQVYHILGEFDSDVKMGIISSRSKLAVALGAHRAGDSVEIPGENAGINCVIEKISPLSPEIKAWINADV